MSHKSNRKSAAATVAAAEVITSQINPSAEVVAETTEVAEEVVAEKKESKVVSSKDKVAFFAPLISEGKFTAKELTEMALAAFPKMTESTIRTFLTDAKNVKYNKFEKLVVLNEEKKLAFAE